MIDYHSNCVSLADFTTKLAAEIFAIPKMKQARDNALADLAANKGTALLGSFTYHLFHHAVSSGDELDLLQRATDLWQQGTGLYETLSSVRADLESALMAPGEPSSAENFNNASVQAQALANSGIELQTKINSLRAEVNKYPHLRAHPRRKNVRADRWDWNDYVFARRTDAFVRSLFSSGKSKNAKAFALGAASAYGGNVAGSAYLGHAVGGPRRLHRFRNRIARNAMGDWFSIHNSEAKSLKEMADLVSFGTAGTPSLPTEVAALLKEASDKTFLSRPDFPTPDFALGYQRLVTHLRLLDGFQLPGLPPLPPQTFVTAIMANPSVPPPSLRPQDVDVDGQDGGGVGVSIGADPNAGTTSPGDSDSNVSKGCGIALLLIILIDIVQAFVQCCVQWGKKETCTFWDNMLLKKVWEQDPPDPRDPTNPQVQGQELVAIAEAPQISQFVWMLFETQNYIWEAMAKSREFLVLKGLIYPGDLLSQPLYTQFTSLPSPSQAWPRREMPSPADNYVGYPTSAVEHPTNSASPYMLGVQPDVILQKNGRLRGADVAFRLWRQMQIGQQDGQNFDLDADRGFVHPCWEASTPMASDPIGVTILKYDEQ